jgi:Holliday junction resolvase RusA-like endonuclease
VEIHPESVGGGVVRILEEIVRLEIPDVEPYPWPRTRTGRSGNHYLPKTYLAYRDLVAMHLRAAYRGDPELGPVRLVLGFYRSTKRKADVDNLAKTILDAGNGIVWADDSQILELVAEISYRSEPSVEILAYTLEPA